MIDGTWQTDIARLENCHDEVIRISKLVGDLEKLTLLEQGNQLLNLERIDIDTMLQRIVSNFQRDFQAKNVALTLVAGTVHLMADEDKLSQVFINLISNALKYTEVGGKVNISTAIIGSNLEVTVSDTGIGIAAEDLPFIFERFYRTDKSRSRETGGSGIGLTIAKSIVEAQGGKITVYSTPGEGSRFIVTLPKA
jgi:signal transduction histidine kinase